MRRSLIGRLGSHVPGKVSNRPLIGPNLPLTRPQNATGCVSFLVLEKEKQETCLVEGVGPNEGLQEELNDNQQQEIFSIRRKNTAQLN